MSEITIERWLKNNRLAADSAEDAFVYNERDVKSIIPDIITARDFQIDEMLCEIIAESESQLKVPQTQPDVDRLKARVLVLETVRTLIDKLPEPKLDV